MPIEHLDNPRAFALLGEMTSTRNLLAYGIRVLRSAPFIETTRDPIMTLLSIGVEKYFKLILGVIALDEAAQWPSKATMMGYGHGITNLFDAVMTSVKGRTENASDYVRGLVAEVEADPVLRPLLDALDRYGRSGRFYNLDLLAESAQADIAPEAMWDQAERAAQNDPAVKAALDHAFANIADNAAWDAAHAAVQGRLAESIDRLWEMLSRVGMNHALGATGGVLGLEVRADAVGRQVGTA